MIRICKTSFEPWRELEIYQDGMSAQKGRYGATAAFTGTMRDFNEDSTVHGMQLDYYPGMTEKHLESITTEAKERWDIIDSLIIHRVGQIRPNEPIVLVAVWSAHRAAAFEASRFLMEELKSRAPFWKKEDTGVGNRWVEKNTEG